MLYEESKWIGNELIKICKPGTRLLNIGSSNLKLRTIIQPHMDKNIFKPLIKIGVEVVHTDLQDDIGVDIVGDLTSAEFIFKLKNKKFDIVLCSNLLEHLTNRELIVNAIYEILPNNGKAIITVPYNYPYHLDPIDTMFRPNVDELKLLFSNLIFVKGALVNGHSFRSKRFQKNYFQQLILQPRLFSIVIIRILFPFYKYEVWKATIKSLTKSFKQFSTSCILIKKII